MYKGSIYFYYFPSFAAYFHSDFKVLCLNITVDNNFYLQNI